MEQTEIVPKLLNSDEFVIFSYHHPEIFEESKIILGYGEKQKADFDAGPFPYFTINDWKGENVECWHFENLDEFELENFQHATSHRPHALCLDENLWNHASETPESYVQKVEQIQQAMHDGEVYVMNLCLELMGEFENTKMRDCPPLSLRGGAEGGGDIRTLFLSAYTKFLSTNPIHCGGIIFTKEQNFCSFSPEVFLHQKGQKFSTYPIKGTGSREVLEQSAKEASELEMVTDLLRNDLGKIADRVWVERPRFFTQLQHFAHAQSEICAEMSLGTGLGKGEGSKKIFGWEAFRSLLPCGSMTGAPKSRVLQLTEQLETFDRGLYAGNFGFRRSKEEGIWNILIRTLFSGEKVECHSERSEESISSKDRSFAKAQDDSSCHLAHSPSRQLSWSFPVGAGITVESDPKSEAEECIAKAKVLSEYFQP